MNSIELRIPPPLVGLLVAAMMYWAARALPALPVPTVLKVVTSGLLALAGAAIDIAGIVAFRRARTTINPLKPQNSSSLVSSGIYRHTRNPMYLGMLFFLVAWAVYLAQPLALLGPLAFALYITRFQIVPEERVLAGLFGEDFAAYKARVRRWL
jgi:protein-S-isoprenylcysteine O-methyltransferase Ste14